MAAIIWSGMISFGLVNIPVKLVNAIGKKTIGFHQLRKTDGCRIRLKRVCPTDGKEVDTADIVKGYEIAPDRYVVIADDELEAIAPKTSRSINISAFVRLAEIDPVYYDHSYYLIPDRGAAKAYQLLLKAMEEVQMVGIARIVLRSKEYLAALRPTGPALSLSTMYFHDEIKSIHSLEIESDVTINEKELAMARQLVESLTEKFDPEKYENQHYQQVMELIDSKAEGETIAPPQVPELPRGKVIDLMAALEESIKAVQSHSPRKKAKKKPKTPA